MTNEQTALLLEGYLTELKSVISAAEEKLEPVMKEYEGMAAAFMGCKEYETYPELLGFHDLRDRLSSDISSLRSESPVFDMGLAKP